jgi:hypothetical protein
MNTKAILSAAMLVSLSAAFAMPADAATKKSKKTTSVAQTQAPTRTVYYRQGDPGYYAPPGSSQSRRYVVRARSYLSAGTETKQGEEHYATYAYPLGGSWDYQNRNNMQGSFTRQPLADPWDIPGWPKY